MKNLLIVYHSQTGKTDRMARAVLEGARDESVGGVEARLVRAAYAGVADLLAANALVLGTPENFGYMSGAMKDFLDRTYYPCEGRLEGLAYSIFVGAGNDGTGAVSSIRRIANGYAWREAREPVIAVGALSDQHLAACRDLGMALAAGLELGMF